jgi:hypothetical protein
MEEIYSPETSVDFQRTIRWYKPENTALQLIDSCLKVFVSYWFSKWFKISDTTSQFCTIAEVVTLLSMQFVDTFIICFYITFHTSSYNELLVISTKPIVMYTFWIVAILFYIVQKIKFISAARQNVNTTKLLWLLIDRDYAWLYCN